MCIIIVYGFAINGVGPISGNPCDATTADALSAKVSVQFNDASEVGKTLVAICDLYRGTTRINTSPLFSNQFTVPYINAITTFDIPFTGIQITPATYNFGSGGVSIHTPDLTSQYCYAVTSTRCTSIVITLAVCVNPVCNIGMT